MDETQPLPDGVQPATIPHASPATRERYRVALELLAEANLVASKVAGVGDCGYIVAERYLIAIGKLKKPGADGSGDAVRNAISLYFRHEAQEEAFQLFNGDGSLAPPRAQATARRC